MSAWDDLVRLCGLGVFAAFAAFAALNDGVRLDLVAWGAVVLMAGWGVMNSRWTWALLHGIGEHWGGVGSAYFVCVWRPGFVDWAAWEDLVGLFGMGSGLGRVFGGAIVRRIDFWHWRRGTTWIGQVWRWAEATQIYQC